MKIHICEPYITPDKIMLFRVSVPGSNNTNGTFCNFQSPKTGASTTDSLLCHDHDNTFFFHQVLHLCKRNNQVIPSSAVRGR